MEKCKDTFALMLRFSNYVSCITKKNEKDENNLFEIFAVKISNSRSVTRNRYIYRYIFRIFGSSGNDNIFKKSV